MRWVTVLLRQCDIEEPSVGNRQAEPRVFSGPVGQGTTVGAGVAGFGLLVVGDVPSDAFEPLGAALLHLLVGFPSLFAAFLVDVVRSIGGFAVLLPPCGDALVDGVGVFAVTAFGQARLTIEDFDGGVVGSVLLGGVIADDSAGGWVVT